MIELLVWLVVVGILANIVFALIGAAAMIVVAVIGRLGR